MKPLRLPHPRRGAAAVEFALVAALFFTVLLGVVEMGRLLWTWNAAAEATRLGARMAAVCDVNDPSIKARMRQRLPALADDNIVITYLNPPAGDNTCGPGTCKAVRVALTGFRHDTVIPLVPLSVPMPSFETTLRKEYMNSTGNAACD